VIAPFKLRKASIAVAPLGAPAGGPLTIQPSSRSEPEAGAMIAEDAPIAQRKLIDHL
jgi:hypothetical protein